ncbi:30S ribosomal protein S8 [Candidatus Dojkabacteria bacterium]|nr:30S ribosomal protein S8 [Candidatus Dojkabacteria bacterium]
MVNDPIADFLTRIRNAIARKQKTLNVPSTKMLEAIAAILKEEGYILDYKVEEPKEKEVQKQLNLKLKYINGESAIKELIRISKPGVRIYSGYRDIGRIKYGLGISILTTPKGLLTGKKAKEEQVGGELLCKIW